MNDSKVTGTQDGTHDDLLEEYMDFSGDESHEFDSNLEHQELYSSESTVERDREDYPERETQLSLVDRMGYFIRENIFYALVIACIISPASWQLYKMFMARTDPEPQKTTSSSVLRNFKLESEINSATRAPGLKEKPSPIVRAPVPPVRSDTETKEVAPVLPVTAQSPVAIPAPVSSTLAAPTMGTSSSVAHSQVLNADQQNLALVRTAMPNPVPAQMDPLLSDRLSKMDKHLEDLHGTVVALNDKLRTMPDWNEMKKDLENLEKKQDVQATSQSSRSVNEELMGQINLLKQATTVVLSELKHQRDTLDSFVHATVGVPQKKSSALPGLTVEALVPGRAWLRGEDGLTQTVAVGDMVRGYGRVKKIDPEKGVIETSSGHVLQQ